MERAGELSPLKGLSIDDGCFDQGYRPRAEGGSPSARWVWLSFRATPPLNPRNRLPHGAAEPRATALDSPTPRPRALEPMPTERMRLCEQSTPGRPACRSPLSAPCLSEHRAVESVRRCRSTAASDRPVHPDPPASASELPRTPAQSSHCPRGANSQRPEPELGSPSVGPTAARQEGAVPTPRGMARRGPDPARPTS